MGKTRPLSTPGIALALHSIPQPPPDPAPAQLPIVHPDIVHPPVAPARQSIGECAQSHRLGITLGSVLHSLAAQVVKRDLWGRPGEGNVTQCKSNPRAGSSLTHLVTSLTRLSNQPVVKGHRPYSVLNNLVPV